MKIEQDRFARRVLSLTGRGLTVSTAGHLPAPRRLCRTTALARASLVGTGCDRTLRRLSSSSTAPPAAQIQELLDEWPEINSGRARLVRVAVMSREPRRLRQAWGLLYARAELVRAMRAKRIAASLRKHRTKWTEAAGQRPRHIS